VVIRVACGLVLTGLLVLALRSADWSLVIGDALHVGPAALAISLAISVLSLIMNGVVWARVLRCLGHPASARLGVTIYAGTGLASYVGMGAGALGQCVLLLRRHGVSARRAALLLTIGTMIGVCGCLVWAPCGLALLDAPAASHALPALGPRAPLVALIAVIAGAAGTVVALWLLTRAPRLGSRWHLDRFVSDPSGPPLRLYLRHLLAPIPFSALAWLVSAWPLWLVVHAAAPGTDASLASVIAVQSVAAVIGGMAFFLPNGLGARDGVTVALLAGVLGVPIAAAAAAALLVRVSDPLAKAMILLALAILARLPTIAHWHSKVHERPTRALVSDSAPTQLGASAATDLQAPTGAVPTGLRPSPNGSSGFHTHGGHTTGRLTPAWQRAAPGTREEKGRNVA
jgi:uncharacterized membrane protein YbhN (UPF0104 family)